MTKFREGDRVKVEFEATFKSMAAASTRLCFVDVDGTWPKFTFQVETSSLTLVERAWQPGDVARDEGGVVYTRGRDCWFYGPKVVNDVTGRLTRLIPEATL